MCGSGVCIGVYSVYLLSPWLESYKEITSLRTRKLLRDFRCHQDFWFHNFLFHFFENLFEVDLI